MGMFICQRVIYSELNVIDQDQKLAKRLKDTSKKDQLYQLKLLVNY